MEDASVKFWNSCSYKSPEGLAKKYGADLEEKIVTLQQDMSAALLSITIATQLEQSKSLSTRYP